MMIIQSSLKCENKCQHQVYQICDLNDFEHGMVIGARWAG